MEDRRYKSNLRTLRILLVISFVVTGYFLLSELVMGLSQRAVNGGSTMVLSVICIVGCGVVCRIDNDVEIKEEWLPLLHYLKTIVDVVANAFFGSFVCRYW